MRREIKSKLPVIAGVMMIVAFLISILTASGLFFFDVDTLDLEDDLRDEDIAEEFDDAFVESILDACGVLVLVFGVFLLLGGIFALKRDHWSISIMGAILGSFSIGPLFLGSLLSLIALILILLSRDEFKEEDTG